MYNADVVQATRTRSSIWSGSGAEAGLLLYDRYSKARKRGIIHGPQHMWDLVILWIHQSFHLSLYCRTRRSVCANYCQHTVARDVVGYSCGSAPLTSAPSACSVG